MTRIEFKAALIIQSQGFVREISLYTDELQIKLNSVSLLSLPPRHPSCKSFFVQFIEQGKWRSRGL